MSRALDSSASGERATWQRYRERCQEFFARCVARISGGIRLHEQSLTRNRRAGGYAVTTMR